MTAAAQTSWKNTTLKYQPWGEDTPCNVARHAGTSSVACLPVGRDNDIFHSDSITPLAWNGMNFWLNMHKFPKIYWKDQKESLWFYTGFFNTQVSIYFWSYNGSRLLSPVTLRLTDSFLKMGDMTIGKHLRFDEKMEIDFSSASCMGSWESDLKDYHKDAIPGGKGYYEYLVTHHP